MAALIAIVAVVASSALYLWIAWREQRNVRSILDYLPLKRYLRSDQYRGTTVAAGMSLATVLIALLNLAPVLGLSLMVTVVTYCLGFVVLYPLIPRILRLNSENLTIPQFVGERYESKAAERVAALFTFIGYLSIFAMELLVGVSIIEPFLGSGILWFAVVYFVFLVTYTWLSGFRGIVATDVLQLRFIILSLLGLAAHWLWKTADIGITEALAKIDTRLFGTWTASLAFAVGIAAINIPAAISDTATWQRLCSTESTAAARRGLRGAIGAFAGLWSAIIVLGILHVGVIDLSSGAGGSSGTLMEGVLISMGAGSLISLGLLLIFLMGLFSAMVSTADSLLMAGTHIFVSSVARGTALPSDSGAPPLRKVRWLMAAMALASFILFSTFRALGMNVVQLVFAIYGAQLALFPSTLGALLLSQENRSSVGSHWVVASITSGFMAAWAAALSGHLNADQNLLFYAPVFGLAIAGLVFLTPQLLTRIKKA